MRAVELHRPTYNLSFLFLFFLPGRPSAAIADWTGQGVPCHDGDPHEFDMQDSLAREWKQHFPGMRFLSYMY